MREPGQPFRGRFWFNRSARFQKTGATNRRRFNCNLLAVDPNTHTRIGWIFAWEQPLPISSRCFAETTITKVQSVSQTGKNFHPGYLALKSRLCSVFPAHWANFEQEAGRGSQGANSTAGAREVGLGKPATGLGKASD